MAKKKIQYLPLEKKRQMISHDNQEVSISSQCCLLGLSRSSFYYTPQKDEKRLAFDYELMKQIDQLFLKYPFYGSRRITASLKSDGLAVNRKRIQRLMRHMCIHAIYPRKRPITEIHEHKIFPYLLRNVAIEHVNHVWSTDITYIPMRRGFLYLVAVIDWYSRYVLSWELSLTLERHFCISALEKSLLIGHPEIFNTDQGSQFTSKDFIGILKDKEIQISMDGRGRAFDNIFVERLWRSVKQEEVYLNDYDNVRDAEYALSRYFEFYNHERYHQGLGYKRPAEVYFGQEA